jgi:hypothetical protein
VGLQDLLVGGFERFNPMVDCDGNYTVDRTVSRIIFKFENKSYKTLKLKEYFSYMGRKEEASLYSFQKRPSQLRVREQVFSLIF